MGRFRFLRDRDSAMAALRSDTHPALIDPRIIAGAAALAGCALLYVRNPADGAPFPPCPFRAVTGLDCPFCGTGRALHQLFHAHVRQAFGLNPLMMLMLPAAGVLLAF